MALIVEGLGNKAIGARLFISEATVKYHMRTIMDKFALCRRAELVSAALRMGIVCSA